ncbi:MAG: AMP-binding protein [Planctomycetaceae bacterium]
MMNHATVYDVLAMRAMEQPEAAAILAPGQDGICFDELLRRIAANCNQLERANINRGDRVALVSPLGPETAVFTLSVASCAVCVPLSPNASVRESAATLKETHARALVVEAGRTAAAEEAARTLGIPVINLSADLYDGTPRCERQGPNPSDGALIMRTSGSSARPKLVPITHEQLLARADKTRRLVDLCSADRCLNLMPFYYMHAINSGLMGPLMAGGSVICPRTVDDETFFDCLRCLRPTWYTAGATHHLNILAWLKHRNVKHELRFARSGSAALPVSALKELERYLGVPVIESFSSTETGTITSNPASWQRKPGTVGITPDDDLAIVDEHGLELAPGQLGEIVVRGPTVVSGYEDSPEMTQAKFRDGWFHTGDLGNLDSDGYLRLRGRLDDVINRGGEKISPQEVDAVLLEHPAVQRALTFAVPHATLHSELVAAVVPQAGTHVTQRELRRYLSERLAPSKIPGRILLTEELPSTPTGKPLRRGAAEYFGHAASSSKSPLMLVRALRSGRERARRFLGLMSPLERSLLDCCRRVLDRDNMGVDDDFFFCGGDSISALNLIVTVEKELHITIPLQYLMETRSASRLAQRLLRTPPAMPDVVAIRTTGGSRPIFAVPGRFGYVLRLLLIGRALGEDQPFYGLQPPGMNWESAGLSAIPEFAAHYIERITSIQANGPYRLLGTSFGGLVVYEMALQLQSAGHEVELLILVDTYPTTCLVNGHIDRVSARHEQETSGEISEVEVAGLCVANAHVRARDSYVMERQFQGELIYFACKDGGEASPDRRQLWSHFATRVRIVPVPGKHGSYHVDPQFSALCRRLRKILQKTK